MEEPASFFTCTSKDVLSLVSVTAEEAATLRRRMLLETDGKNAVDRRNLAVCLRHGAKIKDAAVAAAMGYEEQGRIESSWIVQFVLFVAIFMQMVRATEADVENTLMA